MKFYNQHGAALERTQLHQSDNVCTCCQGYDHAATKYHHDDAECKRCSMLCCCDCHRQPKA